MIGPDKEVYFELYCPKCKHNGTDETDDPCNECLTNPVNQYSHKPKNFKEEE